MTVPYSALILSPQPLSAEAIQQALAGQRFGVLTLTPLDGADKCRWRLELASSPEPQKLLSLAGALQADVLPLSRPLPNLSQPGLLLMDMDSTAIQIECIDEIAALAGIGDQVAEITERAMRGELDFTQSLRARVALLEGHPASLIDQVAAKLPLSEGIAELCAALKPRGWKLAVVSGGFVPMVEQLQQTLGLDAAFANTLEVADGKLTGRVSGDIVDAVRKAELLKALRAEYQLSRNQVLALGDGANDLLMLAEAGLGVAYKAKPKVRAEADWALTHNPLDALLSALDSKTSTAQ